MNELLWWISGFLVGFGLSSIIFTIIFLLREEYECKE